MKPLCIDLFCGLGGWTEGFLAEGWDVIGFDIEQHVYGSNRYPAQLVLQDVLTLHGSQFRDADCIVASPPCQFFSYTSMPWTRAKALAERVRNDPQELAQRLALFNACFRIQREILEAADRLVPLVVENVVGAQKWVGKARAHYGSYYLWGDVPALMPTTVPRPKVGGDWNQFRETGEVSRFNATSEARARDEIKNTGASWFAVAHNKTSGHSRNPVEEGRKVGGSWFGDSEAHARYNSSKSAARKAASAAIAKIPFALSRHIAQVYKPSPACLGLRRSA